MQGFCFKSLAQSEGSTESSSESKIGFGGKVGLTTSSFIDFNDSTYSDYGLGGSIGGFVTYQINEMFFVSGELSYIKRNVKNIDQSLIFDTNSPLFSGDYIVSTKSDIILNNIEAAVKINAYLPTGDKSFKPKVFVGTSIGDIIRANAITERKFNVDNETTLTKDNVTERFTRLDYTFIIGCGADINAGDYEITVDLDYKYGMSNINNVSGFRPFSSNTVELLLGVKF